MVDFLIKAKEIHYDKYNYSLVIYKNARTKIKIICPIHGVFEQRPSHHLDGHGCRECANVLISQNQKKPKKDFIDESMKKHGNKYIYSLVDYKNNNTNVKIICPIHGVFKQKPRDHMKYGCKLCNKDEKNKILEKKFVEKSKKKHKEKEEEKTFQNK